MRDWEEIIRPRLVAQTVRLQAVDVDAIGDDELERHIGALLDRLYENLALHFELHGHDLGPIARYLHAAIW